MISAWVRRIMLLAALMFVDDTDLLLKALDCQTTEEFMSHIQLLDPLILAFWPALYFWPLPHLTAAIPFAFRPEGLDADRTPDHWIKPQTS